MCSRMCVIGVALNITIVGASSAAKNTMNEFIYFLLVVRKMLTVEWYKMHDIANSY